MSDDAAKYVYARADLPDDLRGYAFSLIRMENPYWSAARARTSSLLNKKSPDNFVIISGQNNTGKSVLLSCVAGFAAKKLIPVRYFSEINFIRRHKDTWKNDLPPPCFPYPILPYVHSINGKLYSFENDKRILLWDEFAFCNYRDEVTFFDIFNEAIDRIINQGINVVFATNYPKTKLQERIGKRFWARLERRGIVWLELKKKLVS